MGNFLYFCFVENWHLGIPAYLVLGLLVGTCVRMKFYRHLWKKHRAKKAYLHDDSRCWCHVRNNGEPSFFDFLSYASLFIWPLTIVGWVITRIFGMAGDVMDLAEKTVQKGPVQAFRDEWDLAETRKSMENLWHARHEEQQTYKRLDAEHEKLKADYASALHAIKTRDQEAARHAREITELTKRKHELEDKLAELTSSKVDELSVEEEFRKRTGRNLGASEDDEAGDQL